jgi:predicted nucleotidyltransferase
MRLSEPLDELFQGRSHIKVLRALAGLPDGLEASIREVARRAGVSHPTASGVLDSLRQQGLVHVTRTPWADAYRVNANHVLWAPLRDLLGLERELLDTLVGFLSGALRERAPWVSEAYLFGSAVRGEMEPGSDLDVAVVCAKGREVATEVALEGVGEDVAARFGNRLHTLIGTRPVAELARSRRPASALWRRVADDGVALIASPVSA